MPTYEVTSPDGQTFEVTAPEGASEKEVLAYAQANFEKFTKKDISLGEHVSDIGAGLVSGTGQLLQFPGQLVGLATGAIKNQDFGTTGLQGIGKGMQEWAQEHKSAGLKQREAATQAKVQQAEKEGGQWGALKTQLAESLTDPAQLGSFLAEQVPASLPSILAALIPGVGPEAAAEVKAMQIAAKSATTVAAKEAAERALGEAVKKASESAISRGAAASIGTAAVQQGADVGVGAYQQIYDDLVAKGAKPEEAADQAINAARMAGLSGAAISVLANKLPGAQAMERALAGERGNAGRIIGAGLGALKEIPGEMVEEGGGQFAQNVAARQFNPDQSLTEGVGRAGALAALGAGAMGATVGAVQGRAPEQILPGPVTPTGQANVPAVTPPAAPPVAPAEPVGQEGTPPKEETPAGEPVKVAKEFEDALKDYEKGLSADAHDVFARLQNRDRATPASIQQMQGISAKPDYDRLKTSSDFANGAPVVMSDVRIPENQMGKTEVVTASDGRKIPVQYAVVDAGDLMTSHSADGLTNKSYADMNQQGIRAVAGNGRIAGLQAAYGANTAGGYRNALEMDTQHGIDQGAILNMENPVLVRVMPKSFVTPDIGDVSNVSGGLRMNPVETAANDSNRFDINGINFKDDGSFDKNSLIQFVRAMPKEEQGELMDKNGMPNSKAVDRLNNAIFHRAYGSPSLIDLYAQAADPEAKLILQALARSASKAAALDGAGQYDIRQNIIDAAELAVNARRQGIKLKDYVNQGDIGMDPNTRAVLDMFAENGRSGKRMGELLGKLADTAAAQANAEQDMFGNKTQLPLEDVFKTLQEKPTEPEDLFNKPAEEPEEQKAFDIAKNDVQVEKEITGMDINQANQWLIDNAPNSVAKYIAEKIAARIKAMTDSGIPMTFKVLPRTTRNAGGTATASIKGGKYHVHVEINGANAKTKDGHLNSGSNYKTIMHEMLHAATQPQTWMLGTLVRSGYADQSQLYKELTPLLVKIRRQVNHDIKNGKKHPFLTNHARWAASGRTNPQLQNVSELISYGLTEMIFQDYLKTVEVEKNVSAFSKLVGLFRRLLKIDTQYQSALEQLAEVTERGLEVPVADIKSEAKKHGYTVGKKTLREESVKMPFGKKEQEPTPTGAGVQSMDILSQIGRGNQEADPNHLQNLNKLWNNARDNPKATAEAARQATTHWLDWLETKVFSSDAALNNRIMRGLKEMGKTNAERLGLLLNTSLSQTNHKDALAALFLQKGGLRWNEKLYKWEGVDKEDNIIKLSKQLDELASKNGLTKQKAELVAHTAFEAKRLRSILRFNSELEQEIADIRADADSKRDSDPVASNALYEKANRLQDQKKYVSDEQKAMIGPAMELFKIHPELNDLVDTWNKIRAEAVDTLVKTGVWSKEDAEEMLANADYVPFYREDQLEKNKGPKEYIRGLQIQAREHRLKGSDRPVNDIFDNQVRWLQYSIGRAVSNRSALAMADTAVEVGAAVRVSDKDRGGAPNVVRVWRDGKEEFFSMEDPMFMDAFKGLEAVVIPSWKWASSIANMLRQSVVMYPMFSVAQVPQDSFAAMFSSGLKPQFALRIPVLAVKEFVQTLRGASKTHDILKNVGAVGVRDFTAAMVRMDTEIYAGLKAPPGVLGKIKHSLNHIAMSADNAVRQAVYEASIAQGLSEAEAMEKSFEVFNIRRKGSSKSLALAGQMIPFFSAYLAAQNVAYKTITGRGISPTERQEAFKTLAATTASVMVLSLLYAMMNGDDDDYLKKPATQRDRLLMVPGTGGFSIPLRADLFTMPKIITEHMYLLMTDKGYEDGRKFRDSMNAALGSALLSPTVVPQAIKPLVEVGINYDFFQGRPLIGTYQQKLETERQFTDSTSEMAKILGSTGMASPIAIDHIIRGMFGSVGGLVLYATNPMLHSDPNSPRPSLSERDAIAALPGMSGFMTKSYESALKKDFYTLKEEVDKAANTMNDLKTRSPYEIEGFLAKEENLSRLGLQKSVNAIGEKLSNIRKAVTQISNSNMPADEKREQLKMLREAENEMLKGVDVKALRQLGKI